MRRVTRFFTRTLTVLVLIAITAGSTHRSHGQDVQGYYTDPATGIVYRKVVRTVERPVVETKMTQRQETVYQPKTVTETRPTTLRSFAPVTEFRWVPKVEGRWNPFRQPTVAYQHVPETRWQSTEQIISHTKTHVQWEPVTRTVDVPQRLTRMAREEQVDYEAVGRVPPTPMSSSVAASSTQSNVPPGIAARLRPLPDNTAIQMGASYHTPPPGIYANRERVRSTLQTGLRATELMPNSSSTYTSPPGIGATTGVAGLAPPRLWR